MKKDNPIPPEIILTCLDALYYVQAHVEDRPEIQKAIEYLTQKKDALNYGEVYWKKLFGL